MKNLKMFAIAVMAFAVMATGVHAATAPLGLTCEEAANYKGTCTLTSNTTITSQTLAASDKVVIKAEGHTVTISTALTLDRNSSLTIENGQLILANGVTTAVTINRGATLKVTGVDSGLDGDHDTGAVKVTGASTVLNMTVDGGTFDVSNNNSKGLFVRSNGSASITLRSSATLRMNNNKYNAMNGSATITAYDSKIEAKDNLEGGLNAVFNLTNTDVTTTGNGYSGIVLGTTSLIDRDSKIVATGNLKKDDAKNKDKADVIVNTVEVEGTIEADSIAPEKNTWGNYTINTNAVTLTEDGSIIVKESKTLCPGQGFGGTCNSDEAEALDVQAGSEGALVVGDTATVYGASKINLSSIAAVKKVVIEDEGAHVTVAAGTEVENASEGEAIVTIEGGATTVVGAGQKATIGEPVNSDDQTNPGDQNTGDANTPADGTTGRLPDEPAKTNDNILVYASLGLVSALAVSFSTRRKENN